MLLFILAVAGSALLLTQSVIFAPIRDLMSLIANGAELIDALKNRERGYVAKIAGALAKLVSCPMCAGFWLGLAWGTGLFWPISFPVAFLAYGPAGSLVSAIGVAIWLLLVEIRDASAMWRYLNQPKE